MVSNNLIKASQLLSFALFLTGIQVGQTACIQNNVSNKESSLWVLYFFSLAFCLIVDILILDDFILINSVFGLLCGYHFCHRIIDLLNPLDKWKFQLLVCFRNVVFCLITLLMASNSSNDLYFFIFLNFFFIKFVDYFVDHRSEPKTAKKNIFIMFSAILLPILYRNDINLFRSAFLNFDDFSSLNRALIFCSFVTAISGFIATNFILAEFKRDCATLMKFYPNSVINFSVIGGGVLILSSYFFLENVYFICCCGIVGAIFPYLSSFIHCQGESLKVYFMGAILFILASLFIQINIPLKLTIALYFLMTLIILYILFRLYK